MSNLHYTLKDAISLLSVKDRTPHFLSSTVPIICLRNFSLTKFHNALIFVFSHLSNTNHSWSRHETSLRILRANKSAKYSNSGSSEQRNVSFNIILIETAIVIFCSKDKRIWCRINVLLLRISENLAVRLSQSFPRVWSDYSYLASLRHSLLSSFP